MEIKINKEIKNYHESLFFGLSARQFICSLFAIGVAVGVYFGLRRFLGEETVSWLCLVCAAPVAAAGFFQYNGLTFEKLIWEMFKSEFLRAGVRVYKSENHLQKLTEGAKEYEEQQEKKSKSAKKNRSKDKAKKGLSARAKKRAAKRSRAKDL